MRRTGKRKLSVKLLALLLILVICISGCGGDASDQPVQNMEDDTKIESSARLITETSTVQEQLNELADLYFAGMEENQQVGVADYKIGYNGRIGYAVQYPVTGSDAIDQVISEAVDQMIASFEVEYGLDENYQEDSSTAQDDIQDILYISYESYLGPDKTAGILFERYVESRSANTMPQDMVAYNFSLEDQTVLTSDDIFLENYRETAGRCIREILLQDAAYENLIFEDELEKATADDEMNLNRYVLTPEGVEFCFNKYEIAAGAAGVIKVLVAYDRLADVIRLDMSEAIVVPEPNVGISSDETEAENETEETTEVTGSGEREIDPDKPMVALTFDDGPHKEYSDRILDVLEEHNAVATFFELGNLVLSYPEVVQRAESLGCEVGSHSWAHKNLNNLTEKQIKADHKKTNKAFKKVLGHGVKIMRPPYGNCNETVRDAMTTPMFLWSVDTLDWKTRNTEKIIEEVTKIEDLDGKVILMHSIYETSAEAAEYLIPWLIEEGYQLVTVSEMVEYGYDAEVEKDEVYGYGYFTGR